MSSTTLIISDAQMAKFLAVERQKFIAATVTLLRRDFPALVGDSAPPEIRQQVSAITDRAEKLGFHLFTDVVQFIILALSLGPDFEKQPEYSEVTALLHESDINPSIRLARVRYSLAPDPDELPAP